MAVAEPDQHRRAGRRGLVAALQRLAGLDQREGLRGVDAERLEHLGREHLAHAALQRQPPVAEAAVGRLARALGAEVEQPARAVAELGEQEAAAVADVGIVHAELVAVIAQRQRLRRDCPGSGSKRPKWRIQSSSPRPASPTAGAQRSLRKRRMRLREIGRLDRVVEGVAERRGWRDRADRARVAEVASSGDRTSGQIGEWAWRIGPMAIGRRATGCGSTIAIMPASASRPPILCIPGLTRNARDFEGVADRLAGEWRLICVDLRGRGRERLCQGSDDLRAARPISQDVEALIAELGARALRPVRHLARRADHHAAGAGRQRADRRRPAQRYRPGDRAARARAYPLLCRPLAKLADLAPRRPLPRRGAARPLSRLGASTSGWSTPSGCAG